MVTDSWSVFPYIDAAGKTPCCQIDGAMHTNCLEEGDEYIECDRCGATFEVSEIVQWSESYFS